MWSLINLNREYLASHLFTIYFYPYPLCARMIGVKVKSYANLNNNINKS